MNWRKWSGITLGSACLFSLLSFAQPRASIKRELFRVSMIGESKPLSVKSAALQSYLKTAKRDQERRKSFRVDTNGLLCSLRLRPFSKVENESQVSGEQTLLFQSGILSQYPGKKGRKTDCSLDGILQFRDQAENLYDLHCSRRIEIRRNVDYCAPEQQTKFFEWIQKAFEKHMDIPVDQFSVSSSSDLQALQGASQNTVEPAPVTQGTQ